MNLTNKEIRARARELLDGNIFGKDWIKSVFLMILMGLIILIPSYIIFIPLEALVTPLLHSIFDQSSLVNQLIADMIIIYIEALLISLVSTILSGPLMVGFSAVHLDLVRNGDKISIRKFFQGFRNFVDNFLLGFMSTLHIFLWSLLFVIPGIYVAYSYAMVFHVKNDHPDYRWQQCLDESERLMSGNRFRLFRLHMSFIGWIFVGAFAFLGIGSLWVEPYSQVSVAVFYEQIKEEQDTNIVSFDSAASRKTDPVVVELSHLDPRS